MCKWRWLMMLVLPMLCSQFSSARSIGDTQVLTMNEMFRLADKNSKSIRAYNTSKEAADRAVEVAKAARLPDLTTSLSVSYIADGFLCDRNFSNGMNVDMPHFGNNFSLLASQAIYTGGALSSGIALAELGQQMAALDVEKNRQEVRFLLTGYYLDMYKMNNQIQVFDQNISLTQQLIKNMNAKLEQGTVLKNDITRYELQLENLNMQRQHVVDALKIINHQIVTTIGLPEGTVIKPDTTMLENTPETGAETSWQDEASAGNMNLKQSALAIDISDQKLRLERSELLPKIAVVAEEHLDGPILIEVPVINSNFNYWFLGVGIQYNISSLFKNNKKVKRAQTEARQVREQHAVVREQIENAVQASYTNYLTSFTDLRTQQKSVELANQNYATVNNRYKNDLALLTDMLDASNMKLSAELSLVNARIQVIYSHYKMKYLTHSL